MTIENLTFSAEGEADVSPQSYYKLTVRAKNADGKEILEHFSVLDIIEHFGEDKLLEAIGKDEAKNYFDLVENED